MDKLNLIDIINTLPKNNLDINNIQINKSNFSFSYFFSSITNNKYDYLKMNNPLSFYYSLYYIFNMNSSFDTITNNQIIQLKNKLVLNIHHNKSFFKYITNKCKKSFLIQFIENNEANEYILQYIAESFQIIIAVLDCEIDKIVLYYNGDILNRYQSIFLFSKYNNNYSLLFENDKYEFAYQDLDWIFKNIDICQRCNLEFKKGNSIIVEDRSFDKYLKHFSSRNDSFHSDNFDKKVTKTVVNNNINNTNVAKIQIKSLSKTSLQELQNKAKDLNIDIKIKTVNGKKTKNKTKKQLYDEICMVNIH